MASVVVFVSRKTLTGRAAQMSQASAHATSVLRETHTNLTAAPRVNHLSWQKALTRRLAGLVNAVNRNARFQTAVNSLTVIVITAPIMIMIFMMKEDVLLIAVAVNAGRLFQIVNSTLELFGLVGRFFCNRGLCQNCLGGGNRCQGRIGGQDTNRKDPN